jgi:hypothetical protein
MDWLRLSRRPTRMRHSNLHLNNTGTLSTKSIRVIKGLVNTLSHAVVGAK